MSDDKLNAIAADLETIKKLLILDLARNGVALSKIAGALDIHKSTVSRMFPKGSVAEIVKQED